MTQQKIIGIVITVLALVGGGYLVFHQEYKGAGSNSSMTTVTPPPSMAAVPTPAWYEAHRDALQADNKRCAQQGSNMPPGLCANVAIADKEVSSDDYLNALNQANGTSGK